MGDEETPMPEIINVNGQPYKYTTFRILNKYENGVTPEDCVLIPDDQVVEMVGRVEFAICYVPLCFFPEDKKEEKK